MNAPFPQVLSLDGLDRGVVARVAGFAPCPSATADRLLELGFDEGAEVEALHRAPMGDPLAVRVDGSVVALRRALARLVLLTPA